MDVSTVNVSGNRLVAIFEMEPGLEGKHRMNKISSAALACFCAITLVGCGGSASTILGTDQNPRIRMVDAFGAPASAKFLVDDETINNDAIYQTVSEFHIFKNGNHNFKFIDGSTGTSVYQATQLLELNQFYSVVGYRNLAGDLTAMYLSDKPASSSQDGQVRVANATTAPVDVYVTLPDADIATLTPSVANLQSGDVDAPYVIAPLSGTSSKEYQIRVTTAGSKTVLSTVNVLLGSDQPKTVIVTARASVNSLLPLPTVDYN